MSVQTALLIEAINTIEHIDKFLNSLPKGWLGKTNGDIGELNNYYCAKRRLEHNILKSAEGK